MIADPSAFTPPYDHSLCAALARAGTDVELVTSRFLYGPAPEPAGYTRNELFYRLTNRVFAGRLRARLRVAAKLLEHPGDMMRLLGHIRRTSPQIVHFQWLTVQPLDVRFLERIKVPVVLTAHDVLPREPRAGQLAAARRLYERAAAVVVHSDHGCGRLVDELGIDPAKVHVIPHGAFDYLAKLPPGPIDPALGELGDRPVVLFFGLVRPYKGVDVLIEAFARAPEDALLLVVGMPRMPLEPLEKLARDLGLGDRVRWLPRFVTDPEIPAYFERADLVVLPYREIDQSGVLYTALAFGKPIVVSRVGGLGEIADRDAAALAVPADDPAALGAAIGELLADQARREELAAAARRVAGGVYSWDAVAGKTLELYASLAV